jgi:hypothetical protein
VGTGIFVVGGQFIRLVVRGHGGEKRRQVSGRLSATGLKETLPSTIYFLGKDKLDNHGTPTSTFRNWPASFVSTKYGDVT